MSGMNDLAVSASVENYEVGKIARERALEKINKYSNSEEERQMFLSMLGMEDE